MATARQRRAARRRSIRNHFAKGAVVEWDGQPGQWEIYGHKGQCVLIRRQQMRYGYRVRHTDLIFVNT